MLKRKPKLVDVLEQFRLERDLTYRELATRLDLSTSTVTRLIARGDPGLARTRFKVRRLLASEGLDVSRLP
jgi:DNA-directed RNA polymerase specialized sigma24 family protein